MMNECEDISATEGNPFEEEVRPVSSPKVRTASTSSIEQSRETETAASPITVMVQTKASPLHSVDLLRTTSAPTTPKNNPFVDDVQESKNPFADDEVDKSGAGTNYENVSLLAPAVGSIHVQQRDWDAEWDHVASCVKKNFTSVMVVSPEVVHHMMTK
jgi:hypothetical protein